jgi:cytoskeletal protein CcmA (bactofilin family)
MFFNRKAKKSPSGARSNSAKAAQSEPSFISRECSIDGHVNCEGEIHIDGVVRGSVNAQTCVIEVAGVVHGEVSGDVVEGEVLHDTISIENGAYLYGTVRHNAAPPAQQQQPQQQPKPRTFGSPFDQMAAPEGFDSLLSDQQLEQPAGAEIKKFPPQQRLK